MQHSKHSFLFPGLMPSEELHLRIQSSLAANQAFAQHIPDSDKSSLQASPLVSKRFLLSFLFCGFFAWSSWQTKNLLFANKKAKPKFLR